MLGYVTYNYDYITIISCGARLIHVLDLVRAAAVDALRQRGLHEGVEVAVEHLVGRAGGQPVRRSFTIW